MTGKTCKTCTTCKTTRTDLSDFTFLFPVRINSKEREENLTTVIEYILRHFVTSIIVVEADAEMKYDTNDIRAYIHYEFHPDTNTFFHKTKYINILLRLAETRFVAVWDTDVISAPDQILKSASVIRTGEAGISIPYDGRIFVCDDSLTAFFRSHPNLEILEKLSVSLPLMYGYHSTGGAFLINRLDYLASGGENENFLGWGPEDMERIKSMEVSGIPVHYTDGPMFHLWHPRGITSRYMNKNTEKNNRLEFIKTCAKPPKI